MFAARRINPILVQTTSTEKVKYMQRFWIIAGALNMLAALAFAAATGHAPPGDFVPMSRQILDTAREMHFVHALALVLVSILTAQFGTSRLLNAAGGAFLLGIVCFSGGLDAAYGPLAFDVKSLIPVGGIFFMLGWIMLALASRKFL